MAQLDPALFPDADQVIERDDLPVFIERPDTPPKAGIPVSSEKQLEKAKRRFLLKDAKWTVLE